MTTPLTYQLVTSAELMENHIPASVIDAGNMFFAAITQSGSYVLLSIGSDGLFRSAVTGDGGQTGWNTLDISPTIDAGAVAKSFSASYNPATNLLSVLLVLTGKTGGSPVDTLYSLSGPAGADPSVWLLAPGSITATSLPFDDATVQPPFTIGPAKLTIEGVYVENGLTAHDAPLMVATVQDQTVTGEVWCFLIAPLQTPAWSYFEQEQNLGVSPPAQIAPGRDLVAQKPGIYKLYTLGGQQTLSFLPSAGVYSQSPGNAAIFVTPDGASAIAPLVYVNNQGTTVSDLFVAGNGTLTCFPANTMNHQPGTIVVSDPLITATTQLHAVYAVDKVLVWGVNGAGQVFYTAAAFASRATAGAWQKPLPLLSNTVACTPIQGTPSSEADLFAYSVLPAGTSATQGKTSVQGLVQLSRNPTTSFWETTVVATPTTEDTITLQSYTTRVLLTDGAGVPQANLTLSVTPSADCSLILNGVSTTLTGGESFSLITDGGGNANIIHSISSLAAVGFTFTLPDGSTVQVDPGAAVQTRLQGISQASDLTSATYVAADGSTQPLVSPGTGSDVVAGTAQAINTLATKGASLPSAAASSVRVRPAATPPQTLQDNESFFDSIGDLVQSIVHGIEDIADIVLQEVEGGIKILITVGEDILSAIVETVEDVYAAITAVLKWIGAELEAVFRWLAFLFDWSSFVAVAAIFEETVSSCLTSFTTAAEDIQSAADDWFTSAIANLENAGAALANAPGSTASGYFSSNQPSSYTVGGMDSRSDPKIGWMKDRVGSVSSGGGSSVGAPGVTLSVRSRLGATTALSSSGPEGTANPFDQLSTLANGLSSDFGNAVGSLQQSVTSFVNGEIGIKDFFQSLFTELEVLGLGTAQTIFDTVMVSLEDLASDLQSILSTPITIPVLSPLYKAATGQELTILNLICLLLAILFTIIYKLATNADPVADLKSVDFPQALAGVVANSATYLGAPAAVGAMELVGTGTGATVPAIRSRPPAVSAAALAETESSPVDWAADIATMLRSVTVFVLGAEEVVAANAPAVPPVGNGGGLPAVLHLTDLILRMVAIGSKLQSGQLDEGMQKVAAFQMVTAVGLCFFVFGDLTKNPGPSIDGTLREIDGLANFALGIWAIVELAENCPENEVAEIMEMIVEMGEVPQMVLLHFLALNKGNIDLSAAAFTVVGLRAIAALGAGLADMSES